LGAVKIGRGKGKRGVLDPRKKVNNFLKSLAKKK